jgi:hypothetical protein
MIKQVFGAALATGLTGMAAPASATSRVEVLAGYLQDTSFIEVVNYLPTDFSDPTITSVDGPSPGESFDFGPLARAGTPGDVNAILFEEPSGAFANDYDEDNSLETSYVITLTAAGHAYRSNVFSPSSNQSGGYVDFLGLDADNDFDPVLVATASVPEPAGWALMMIGFAAVGASARRRRAAGGAPDWSPETVAGGAMG